MTEFVNDVLTILGGNVQPETGLTLAKTIAIALLIIFTLAAYFVTKYLLLNIAVRAIARSNPKWSEMVVNRKVFQFLAFAPPAVVIALMTPLALAGQEKLIAFVSNANSMYVIVVSVLVINAGLNTFLDIYHTFELSKAVPLKSVVQIIKVGLFVVAGFLTISLILNIPLIYLISGLGALAAVAGFVFKDPILGFVAGIQLAANKLVAIGDWIEMPEFGANGDVLEINLTTVKIQNWDKTITTVPTYALISQSFKNWRGMQESGGRRIKRAVYIDLSTVKVCPREMLAQFSKIGYISDYIEQQKKELAKHNGGHPDDDLSHINGERLTNIGLFRAYVTAYLKDHPKINQDMTLMVRQLDPTDHGLPVEIYAFCKDKAWSHYEMVQSDIFDHILTIVPEFELELFQHPSGTDFKQLAGILGAERPGS